MRFLRMKIPNKAQGTRMKSARIQYKGPSRDQQVLQSKSKGLKELAYHNGCKEVSKCCSQR